MNAPDIPELSPEQKEKLMRRLFNAGDYISRRLRHIKVNRYFVEESLVKEMLYSWKVETKPSPWINYKVDDEHYRKDARQIILKRAGQDRKVKLPYREEISFIRYPDAKIDARLEAEPYRMDPEIAAWTGTNLEAFRQKKPGTTDGPILRIKSLTPGADGANWYAALQRAGYFDQVRTNLTLDCVLNDKDRRTLRSRDIDREGNLKPLHQSLMVNSIGASAVCFYRDEDRRKRFFMKVRRSSEGVFEEMLGSTSGVVEPPLTEERKAEMQRKGETPEPHQLPELTDLVAYAAQEVLREFRYETGLSEDDIEQGQVRPLAFVRELIRGGKPQFFFLIELKPITNAAFKERFQKAVEGLQEFHDDFRNNWKSFNRPMSPELAANLFYAFEYFQKAESGLQAGAPLKLD